LKIIRIGQRGVPDIESMNFEMTFLSRKSSNYFTIGVVKQSESGLIKIKLVKVIY